jgi:hypothetical protein
LSNLNKSMYLNLLELQGFSEGMALVLLISGWRDIMKNLESTYGNVMVTLLVLVIIVSVASTALMNIHQSQDQHAVYRDVASVMSIQAKNVFDKISYHVKLAGYANSRNQKAINIVYADQSDTLIIWHNNVEIKYYVNLENNKGVLCESIDGAIKVIANGVQALRLIRSSHDLATIEISLSSGGERLASGIIAKSYATTLRLKNYL